MPSLAADELRLLVAAAAEVHSKENRITKPKLAGIKVAAESRPMASPPTRAVRVVWKRIATATALGRVSIAAQINPAQTAQLIVGKS